MAVEPISQPKSQYESSQYEETQGCCGCPCCCSVDYSDMDSSKLVELILRADLTRRKLEGLVAEMLVRLGELEGDASIEGVCEQFGRGRYAARRQAKGAWLLKGLAATLDATAEGLVSVDHARLIGESNQRVSFTSAQEVEIIGLAITQDFDEFKKTVLHKEDLRRGNETPTPYPCFSALIVLWL